MGETGDRSTNSAWELLWISESLLIPWTASKNPEKRERTTA